eukprot:8017955-Pyramimonas_sp.AAC.1
MDQRRRFIKTMIREVRTPAVPPLETVPERERVWTCRARLERPEHLSARSGQAACPMSRAGMRRVRISEAVRVTSLNDARFLFLISAN